MELLVFMVDRVDEKDPINNARLYKRGDVVAFHEDGADWGIEEVKNPLFRIVKVPGMSLEEATALVSWELPPTLDKKYPLLQRRGLKLDLDSLDALEAGKVLSEKSVAVSQVEAVQFDEAKGDADLSAKLKEVAVHAELAVENVRECMILKEALK